MQATLDGVPQYKIEACKGYGEVPADYMFVGISAGKLGAVITKVPFTKDMSGRLLQRTLYHIGLSETEDEKTLKPKLRNCYITNLVKGLILDEDGNNRLPNDEEIKYWLPTLNKEILEIKPKWVVALGALVFKWLIFFSENELIVPIDIINMKHPRAYGSRGAINTNTQAWKDMLDDYKRLITPASFLF